MGAGDGRTPEYQGKRAFFYSGQGGEILNQILHIVGNGRGKRDLLTGHRMGEGKGFRMEHLSMDALEQGGISGIPLTLRFVV